MDESWIKLYRKVKEKGWYKKSEYVHLWVHILIRADHEEKEFLWNGKMMKTKKGQFITGRKKLSADTGIAETTIERILKTFENEHQIEQQKTNRFRLISVVNWEKYQAKKQVNGQQTDNKRTSGGHLADTDKNIRSKEVKNLREESTVEFLKNIPQETIEEFTKKFNIYEQGIKSKAETLYDWVKSKGKESQYKDYRSFLRNAIRKDFGDRKPEDLETMERIRRTKESLEAGPSPFAKSLADKMKM